MSICMIYATKGRLKKDYLICVSKVRFYNTKKATLIVRGGLLNQKRPKNKRQMVTLSWSSCTTQLWHCGFWWPILVPSYCFIGKDGLHCIIRKCPNTELSKFQRLLLSHNILIIKKNTLKSMMSHCCAAKDFRVKFIERNKVWHSFSL